MMSGQNPSQSSTVKYRGIAWVVIVRFLVATLLLMAVLFVAAGKVDWWEGWAYVVQALIVLVVSRAILIRKSPDLARERADAGKKENVKPWDRVLMPVMSIFLPLASWIVCGLDERFGWTPDLPNGIQIMALFLIFASSMFGTWAMIANRFFSSHVRIQTERGHTVVSSGPYRFVRHPGYAGNILAWIASPVFFSSTWAAIPASLAIVATVTRTVLEDRTLQVELPGYRDYAQIVRRRLIPGIW